MSVFRRPRNPYDNATAPVGDLISEVGRGVAEAQQQLDAGALDSFRALYSQDDVQARELRAIGYLPTWYQIPETTAEINMSMSMGMSRRSGGSPPLRRLLATAVDASVQNQFDFKAELSSKIQFRIVPIPPPVDAASTAVVPELAGLSLGQATALLQELDMAEPVLDTQTQDPEQSVLRQDPEPGTLIAREDRVSLFTR